MRMPVVWWLFDTWNFFIIPTKIFSLIKWQSTFICLVRSWKTGFATVCKAAWSSQNIKALFGCGICKSLIKENNQVISQAVLAMALYSTLADDLDIVDCFLDFNNISLEWKIRITWKKIILVLVIPSNMAPLD